MDLNVGTLKNLDFALGQLMDQQLPGRVSYWVSKFITQEFRKELEFNNKKAMEICQKYVDKSADGTPVIGKNGPVYSPENEEKANQELAEMEQYPITLNLETYCFPFALSEIYGVSKGEFETLFRNRNYKAPVNLSPRVLSFLIEMGIVEDDLNNNANPEAE